MIECPNCGNENAYCDGVRYVCPDCDYEWDCDEIEALEEEFYQIEKIKGHQKNGNYNDYVDKLAVKASTWLMEKK